MTGVDRVTLAGAVHDVNNALQSLSASLNLIERRLPEDGNPAIGRLLQSARDQLANAGLLVRRMLLEAGPAEESVDLRTLVHGMAAQIEAVLGDGTILDLRDDGTRHIALCDPSRLRSGLLNTVLNARDAMDGGGTLTISVRRFEVDGRSNEDQAKTGSFVEIEVTDTGRGMDETFAARAFEPYVTTKDVEHGAGLGLFQLRRFVESSRGFVRLTSREGVGTSVAIALPLAE